ncbi:MAG TPA: hypothetical protein PLM75_04100 [bacterium]|nr:hypothetical protein [bacterium]
MIADYQTTDKKNVYTIIAGRDREGKDNQYYARNSFVLGYTRNFENKQKLLFSAALSQDDKNSISEDTAIIPVRNYHTGVYGLFKLFAPLLLEFEFTHSFYKPTTFEDTDTIEDNAAMLKLNYKQDKAQATFEFNRVGSDFYTLNGIATPDKENINFNYRNVYKIFNYNINTRYQFDDLKKRNNKRNYVFEHKAGCNFKPLEEFTEGLRYIELFLEVLKSEKYNKISNSSVDRDNDLSTINAKYRFFNKLFDNQYLFNISFEHEREIDNLLNKKIYMRILEFDNNFKTKIIEKFTIDLRLKTRYKTYIADKEKYLNGSIAFIYNTPTLNFNIGYYTDITNSNQPNQDSRKHRYMFNCEYSQKLEKYSRALTLNLEYNENKFEDITLNYNKLSINTGLKIIF